VVIALLADIHSNLEALSACLKHAGDNGAGRVAFLGDLVGYGADPQAVLNIVSQRTAAGSVAVKGNHDEAIEKRAGYMNDTAQAAIDWTKSVLSPGHKAFLASLPLCVREEPMCFVHASAATPQRWEYVDSPAAALRSVEAAQSAYTFSGHVHDQLLYFQNPQGKMAEFRPVPGSPVPVGGHRRWLAIVGSVGQPRDNNPAAAYALFDAARANITFHRVPYDHLAAAQKIRKAGLPEFLAYRVERGI
jgi:diadenosine tetraphosphatase ApaH/serine/threonine PP2A family protein phosphatase